MTKANPRTPPASPEAEESLIACCLIDGTETIPLCVEAGITAESFYDPVCRLMFEHLTNLQNDRQPTDAVMLAESLKKAGQLDSCGGIIRLSKIQDRAPTTAHRAYFIQEIRNNHLRRQLIEEASRAIEKAYNCQDDASGLMDEVQSRILGLSTSSVTQSAVTASTVMDEVGKLVDDYLKGEPTGAIPSGFIDLDNLTYGFQPGDMIILGARPSCGKTALALNFAENISTRPEGGNVLFFSLEMSQGQLGFRMLTSRARVRSNSIKRSQIGKESEEIKRLQQSFRDLRAAKVWIDDCSFQTVNTIRAKARTLHKRLETSGGLKCIVIDYLQLITASNPKEPREQQVSLISKNLKGLAKELHVPVIVLSQLSRANVKENRTPRLSDLRESGSLEQDADLVLLLYPQISNDEEGGQAMQVATEEMNLDVAKQRNGACDTIKLAFTRDITRFDNWTGRSF